MTVEEVVRLGVEEVVRLGRAPYRGGLGKISAAGEAAIASALSRTQSGTFASRRFDGLSGGEQARVLLARALAVDAPNGSPEKVLTAENLKTVFGIRLPKGGFSPLELAD